MLWKKSESVLWATATWAVAWSWLCARIRTWNWRPSLPAVTLVPTTFEWAEDIDLQRAENAAERANALISSKEISDVELRMAEARLKRALVRSSVAKMM